jgi:hypothetical protein
MTASGLIFADRRPRVHTRPSQIEHELSCEGGLGEAETLAQGSQGLLAKAAGSCSSDRGCASEASRAARSISASEIRFSRSQSVRLSGLGSPPGLWRTSCSFTDRVARRRSPDIGARYGPGNRLHEQIRVIENLSHGDKVHRMLSSFCALYRLPHCDLLRHRRRAPSPLARLVRLNRCSKEKLPPCWTRTPSTVKATPAIGKVTRLESGSNRVLAMMNGNITGSLRSTNQLPLMICGINAETTIIATIGRRISDASLSERVTRDTQEADEKRRENTVECANRQETENKRREQSVGF